jgi:hypothetical protein
MDWLFGTAAASGADVKKIWQKSNQKVGVEGNSTTVHTASGSKGKVE